MSTPNTPTEAHRKLAVELILGLPSRSCESASVHGAAQLIADSEARAVATAVTMLTCTNHNDKQRAECPVCLVAALTAERDSLRTQVEQKRHLLVIALRSAGDQAARAVLAEAELERLRLELKGAPTSST